MNPERSAESRASRNDRSLLLALRRWAQPTDAAEADRPQPRRVEHTDRPDPGDRASA